MWATDMGLKYLLEDIVLLSEIVSMLAVPLRVWLSIWGFSKLGEMNLELQLLTFGQGQGEVRLDEFAIRALRSCCRC